MAIIRQSISTRIRPKHQEQWINTEQEPIGLSFLLMKSPNFTLFAGQIRVRVVQVTAPAFGPAEWPGNPPRWPPTLHRGLGHWGWQWVRMKPINW